MRSQDTKSQAHWMKPGDTETGIGSVDQIWPHSSRTVHAKTIQNLPVFSPQASPNLTDPTDGIASVGSGLRFKLINGGTGTSNDVQLKKRVLLVFVHYHCRIIIITIVQNSTLALVMRSAAFAIIVIVALGFVVLH